jgi:hypothetical protein
MKQKVALCFCLSTTENEMMLLPVSDGVGLSRKQVTVLRQQASLKNGHGCSLMSVMGILSDLNIIRTLLMTVEEF